MKIINSFIVLCASLYGRLNYKIKDLIQQKKYISFSLIFIFVIIGCSDDNFYDKKYSDEITFSVVNDEEIYTRGTPIITSNDISNICVYGYYTGDGSNNTWEYKKDTATPSFFNGITVTNSGKETGTSSWSYVKKAFWPGASDANISFFAYSPVEDANNGITVTNTTGVPTLHYSTPTTTSYQPDLVIAIPELNLNKTSPSPITFSMKHALTCIGFEGLGDNKIVESISLSGISLEGDLVMDGTTINWTGVSEPSSTSIEVGLQNDTLTTSTNSNLTASDGYIMLIPQILDNVTLTVKIEGEDEIVVNLPKDTLEAGQLIKYKLIDNYITVSPSSLTISALGVDTDTLFVKCVPYNIPWTLTSPVSWLKFSSNVDGSGASETISGTKDTKIYIIIDPNMVNTSQKRTAAIYANNNTSNVKVNVTQNYMMNIPSSDKTYAGAFWRCAQKGERLIRIPSSIGKWDASVFWLDERWNEGDIILEAGTFTWPASEVSADSDTPPVSGTATKITGNTSDNNNMLSFRIGLSSTYTATSEYPARYALVAITWNNGSDAQFFFIRQGEDPDYLMRPTDIYGNDQTGVTAPNWRPLANKISPFNLTAKTLGIACSPERDADNPSLFTDYPSQAGAFFQWASAVNTRYAYSAVTDPTTWDYSAPTDYWDELSATNESSPIDYELTYGVTVNFRRPRDGSIDGPVAASTTEDSEIVQSLYYTPYSSVDNMIYAYLADGYFDRLQFTGNNGVNGSSNDVAYWGQLVYNPINKASLFIPYTGYITGTEGGISSKGQYINMWTSSSDGGGTALIWNYNYDDGGALLDNNRGAGFTVRPFVDNDQD